MKNRYILTPFFLDEAVPDLESLAQPGWRINKPSLPPGEKQDRLSVVHQAIADGVSGTAFKGERPVSLAGDCCTAIGVLAGLQRAGIHPSVIWFDAHGDFNTWETTPSGFLGGMPLAMIAGIGDQTLCAAVGLKTLPENRVILTDARDLDPGERKHLEASRVVHIPKTETLLDEPMPAGPLYVHFDVDVVSLQDSPAQNYPARGGPSLATLQTVFRRIAQTGNVAAVSLAAWNFATDKDKKSEKVSMSLLQDLVGDKYEG